jgi:HME family heavy-metal exporter
VRVIGRLGPNPQQVIDDLQKVVVDSHRNRPILLGQVAEIIEGPAPKRGDASINGLPGIVVTVVKQPHADTRELTDKIKSALREAQSSLPPDLVINTDLFQLRAFIDRGIYYVGESLVIGAVLAAR